VKPQKVFCIGWQKTGTTSMGAALKILGYRVGGWESVNGQLVLSWHEGNLAPIIARAQKFEAFEDFPWPLVYRELDARFYASKFVLTVRKDEQTWLRSFRSHFYGKPWVGHYLLYGSYDPVKDADQHVRRYREHNEAVRAYFSGRDNFLEMCFENGDGWPQLCGFLGEPEPVDIPFPHANKSLAFATA
jgi:hypothetical protein